MEKISLHSLKHTLKDIHKNTESRKFCFVLGAGASAKSGIPTGGELAEKWFKEIKERLVKSELEKWIKKVGLVETALAAHYGSIYRKRFENDKTSGYEFLVQAMKEAKPTFGHFVLAQILSKVPGHCVITTNFDSLIESAIYQYTDKTPLVCGHESLSGYARPSNIHPLVIKIHRDLLLAPKSDPDEINALDAGWKNPLDVIFSGHIPIVIGYGGNDGSLMTYFENMNKPSNFFWCGRKGGIPAKKVKALIEKMGGSYVEVDGFDEMMKELLTVFDEIKPIKEELDAITKSRIDDISSQFMKLKASETNAQAELSAFEYSTLANNEPDLEKRNAIYLEAINKFPKTDWLMGNYALFLHEIKKDYLNAEKYYRIALALAPKNEIFNLNFAVFLNHIKKDYASSERLFIKAISLAPDNVNINIHYAVFLKNVKKDYSNAEKHYHKALSFSPNDPLVNARYAIFLNEIKKDNQNAEKYFSKALFASPNEPSVNCFYAGFLISTKKIEEARIYLKKAFELNQNERNGLLVLLWFYFYASNDKMIVECEREIEGLLKEGYHPLISNLDTIIEGAIENGHPQPKKLKELADRITKLPS